MVNDFVVKSHNIVKTQINQTFCYKTEKKTKVYLL